MHWTLVPRHERRLRRHAQTECRRREGQASALRPGHWRALLAQREQGPCRPEFGDTNVWALMSNSEGSSGPSRLCQTLALLRCLSKSGGASRPRPPTTPLCAKRNVGHWPLRAGYNYSTRKILGRWLAGKRQKFQACVLQPYYPAMR